MQQYRPPVLGGNRSDSQSNAVNFAAQTHPSISNVQIRQAPEVNPLSAQTLGRAKTMWAFRNPVQGQGTFIKNDEGSQIEMPHSDPGSAFALNKEY